MRLSLAFLLLLSSTAFAQTGYHITKRIPIGGEGGWDYLIVDPDARRVYVSHAAEVDVIDADSATLVGKITGLKGVHGIALAPKLSRGFISNGQSGTVTAFDLKTLKKIGDDQPAGKNPDAILFDPATSRVFAFNGQSSNITAFDAELFSTTGTIALEGKPEFAVADEDNAVFVNIEDQNAVLRIDARKLLIEQKWPLDPCDSPSGLAMDRSTRRLFAGCHNKMMAVVDANNGKVVATVPICQGIDATAFEPGTGLIFNSCGDGTITVIHEESPDSYKVVETVKTQAGARTMALDPKTHKLFLPVAEYEPAPPAAEGQPRSRPKMVSGSFSILVLEK